MEITVSPKGRRSYLLKRYDNEIRIVDVAKEMSVRKEKKVIGRGRKGYLPPGTVRTSFRVTNAEFEELKKVLRAYREERGYHDIWSKPKAKE